MSMGAALKAERALQLASLVMAIEVLCACQAIDLLAPLTSSPPLMRVHAAVRDARADARRRSPPAPDIDAIAELIRRGALEYATGVVVN